MVFVRKGRGGCGASICYMQSVIMPLEVDWMQTFTDAPSIFSEVWWDRYRLSKENHIFRLVESEKRLLSYFETRFRAAPLVTPAFVPPPRFLGEPACDADMVPLAVTFVPVLSILAVAVIGGAASSWRYMNKFQCSSHATSTTYHCDLLYHLYHRDLDLELFQLQCRHASI